MARCPKCQSDRVSARRIVSDGEASVFPPASLRASSFTLHGGVALRGDCFAFAECGLVWGFIEPGEFGKFPETQLQPTGCMNERRSNQPDGAHRRQPVGLRVSVGKADIRGPTAAAGHPERYAAKFMKHTALMVLVIVLSGCVATIDDRRELNVQTHQSAFSNRRSHQAVNMAESRRKSSVFYKASVAR